jgi:hypothetical protein
MEDWQKGIEELINEKEIGSLVVALCATLYDNGIRYVHIGGLMRILGVEEEVCQQHDEESFLLDDDFYEKIEEMGYVELDESDIESEDVTIH